MPTVFTHAVIGWTAADVALPPTRGHWRLRLCATVLPVLPDLDGLLLPWIPYAHAWGHRGMTHSVAFALVLALIGTVYPSRREAGPGGHWLWTTLLLWAVTASHGVLDALTDGGLGIALLAPFDDRRIFFSVTPIPVSPLGRHFFSAWGAGVLAWEVALIWTFCAALVIARRAPGGLGRWVAAALAGAGVFAWGWRCGGA